MASKIKATNSVHLVYPLRIVKELPNIHCDDCPDEEQLKQLVLLTFDEEFHVKLSVFPENATTCRCKTFRLAADCDHIRPIVAWQKFIHGLPEFALADPRLKFGERTNATYPPVWVKGEETQHYMGSNLNKCLPKLVPPGCSLASGLDTVSSAVWGLERVFREVMSYSLVCRSVKKKNEPPTIFKSSKLVSMEEAVDALNVLLNVSGKARDSDKVSKAKAKFAKYRGESELGKILTKTACPKEDEFYVHPKTWVQSLYCLNTGSNVLLTGPSGCGKSELVKLVAGNAKRPFEAFNFGGMTEPRSSLIGNVEFTPEKGTFFSESRFVRAIQTPNTVVLLDEISRAPRDAFNILLPLLDGQRYLPLDESKENATAEVAKGVTFWATANEGMEYTGTSILDRALRDRFQVLDLEFMPADKERAVITKRCGIPGDVAGYLVDIAHKQRLLTTQNDEFSLQISTRSLIAAGNQFAFGVPLCEALEYCVECMFSADGDQQSERTAVRTIINKVIPVAELNRSTT